MRKVERTQILLERLLAIFSVTGLVMFVVALLMGTYLIFEDGNYLLAGMCLTSIVYVVILVLNLMTD